MILSISVTKQTLSRSRKTAIVYLFLTFFFFIFSRIYISLSYGELSFFMNYLFLVPLIGGASILIILHFLPSLSRVSFNLWNSGIAIFTSGFLLRGIINLSGRSTTLDKPYWLLGSIFLLFSLISIVFTLFVSKNELKNKLDTSR